MRETSALVCPLKVVVRVSEATTERLSPAVARWTLEAGRSQATRVRPPSSTSTVRAAPPPPTITPTNWLSPWLGAVLCTLMAVAMLLMNPPIHLVRKALPRIQAPSVAGSRSARLSSTLQLCSWMEAAPSAMSKPMS